MERLILLPIIAVCLARSAGYGFYTIRENNRTGAVGIFALTLIAAVTSVYFFMQ